MDNSILLYEERDELIKSLLNVKDVNLIKKIRSILNKETTKLPAQMTVEEMRESVFRGIEESKKGRGKSIEQVFEEVRK